jgi:hypothetical protein
MSAAPTQPIPASASRTLRFNRLATIWTPIIAAAPTVISFVLDAMGDPQIAAFVSGVIPGKYRALIVAVVVFLAQRNRTLRYQTTAPIATPVTSASSGGASS